MKHKFAVFDIDGTLIRWQLYHVVVNRLAKSGALGAESQSDLKVAMMSWKKREDTDAFLAYQSILVNSYEQALKNINTSLFDELVTEAINEYKDQTYIYTKNLIQELKNKNYKLFIISGSHIELIEQIGIYYGFDDWMGTKYERQARSFTGKIIDSTLDKKLSLEVLISRNNVTIRDSIAIGDTKSDIPMLEMVEFPIAFNPDKYLFEAAKSNSWKIVVERKNVIYDMENRDGRYQLLA